MLRREDAGRLPQERISNLEGRETCGKGSEKNRGEQERENENEGDDDASRLGTKECGLEMDWVYL